jgi:hypothetical protein
MKRGSHAADDGSFGRSAGTSVLRGAILIIVAVVLGLILLNATDTNEPFTAAQGDDDGTAATTTTVDEDGGGGTTTTTAEATVRPPAEVTVLVANGTSVKGAAGQYKDQLAAKGYQTVTPVDTRTKPLPSGVFFIAGYEAEANALALTIDPAPPVQAMPAEPPVADLGAAQILVVVGADLTG